MRQAIKTGWSSAWPWCDTTFPASPAGICWRGCPSRCAALMHLYQPRRFLGPSPEVGARWEDQLRHGRNAMGWDTDAGEREPIARSEVRSRDAVVVTPAGRFEGCLEVHTAIAPPEGGNAAEHSTRSYCGERTVSAHLPYFPVSPDAPAQPTGLVVRRASEESTKGRDEILLP